MFGNYSSIFFAGGGSDYRVPGGGQKWIGNL